MVAISKLTPSRLPLKMLLNPLSSPTRTLLILFASWKFLLLLVALGSPGPGYDTSTDLLLASSPAGHVQWSNMNNDGVGGTSSDDGLLMRVQRLLAGKLVRWDAIYFVEVARRDYLFEQEWAFGFGFTRLIAGVTSALTRLNLLPSSHHHAHSHDLSQSLAGILLAHTAHLLAVLALHRLCLALVRGGGGSFHAHAHARGPAIALAAAALHVVSPAGLFLSAPYAEGSFALLSFAGCLLLVRGRYGEETTAATTSVATTTTTTTTTTMTTTTTAETAKMAKAGAARAAAAGGHGSTGPAADAALVAAGAAFGLATALRSNGLLYGLLFAEEAVRVLRRLSVVLLLAQGREDPGREGAKRWKWGGPGELAVVVRRGVAVGLGGVAVAAGFLGPQYVAYVRFCGAGKSGAEGGDGLRPWCLRSVPSIYTFVQEHYWNSGFLRYWTVSNIPLFLLACPMLLLLSLSSVWGVDVATSAPPGTDSAEKKEKEAVGEDETASPLVSSLARVQLLLAGLAVTNYHVQIITRIASGYPVLYLWLAVQLVGNGESGGVQNSIASKVAHFAPNYMVLYALIQGGLFASFLPPA